MRLIHTADWHLGRILFGVHLTGDQSHILDQLVALAADYKPDAILVSGDIYDRAVPPPDAIRLLDHFLERTVMGLNIPVIMIAGNHDSPDRLGFASRLLEDRGLFLKGSIAADPFVTTLTDTHGPVDFYAVPYAEPVTIREVFDDETVRDHHTAMETVVGTIRKNRRAGRRTVLLSHAFVAGSGESESERPLSVGGSGAVPPSVYDNFSYVALGHLHSAQKAGKDTIRYSGSIMPYSFSENSSKSVTLVDIDAHGECHVETATLTPKNNLRIIRGTLEELLNGTDKNNPRHDYIQATLLDKGPVLDAMGRLRDIYPNILHVERPYLLREGNQKGHGPQGDHRTLSDTELFASFFKDVTGDDLSEEMEHRYSDIVEEFRRHEREAAK